MNQRLSRKEKLDLTRQACEADLEAYIRTVAPQRVLGDIHKELISWWTRQDAKDNQLVLLPRAHQKSQLVAYRTAWELTRSPELQFLYVSATSDLAEKQLGLVKQILESPKHQLLWPQLIHPEEGKRRKWSVGEIEVDHPKRISEGVRDPSIKSAGLTTNITGFHADRVILDDIVVPGNAYTEEGRNKVAALYSQLASIENPGAKEWVVGTRYHPADIYSVLLDMKEGVFDAEGELVDEVPVYEFFTRVVETDGEFLWPRQRRKDGKYFGFNQQVLSRIKAKYVDRTQFYAQYYNDPNDPELSRVGRDRFQYYERKFIHQDNGYWWYRDRRLNIAASIDFAFTENLKSDWTAIVVAGIDGEGFIYVLDIDRFKTSRISDYYKHLFDLHHKWDFRKLRAETSVAQGTIVRDLMDNYIRPNGLMLTIDEYRPNRHEGRKEERIAATLLPRYDNKSVWHYKGGNCQILEEEIIAAKPEHDDVVDALCGAIDILKPPARNTMKKKVSNIVYDSRFGGVAYRG